MKPAWTLHEIIVSLAITGGIFVLASGAALGQLRFFRGVGEVVALRSQLSQAIGVTASVLGSVETPADVLGAEDSAADVRATYGAAFACSGDTGRIVVPAGSEAGNTLGAFADLPQAGDAVRILLEDDSTAVWVTATVAGALTNGPPCARFPGLSSTWSIALVEPLVVSAGSAVRLSRRSRIGLYRAADSRWYLGLREWNGATGRFNAVQPVAGPLLPYGSSGTSGFELRYADRNGAPITLIPDPAGIATVTVIARGESTRPARVQGLSSRSAPRYGDSLSTVVALRNLP